MKEKSNVVASLAALLSALASCEKYPLPGQFHMVFIKWNQAKERRSYGDFNNLFCLWTQNTTADRCQEVILYTLSLDRDVTLVVLRRTSITAVPAATY